MYVLNGIQIEHNRFSFFFLLEQINRFWFFCSIIGNVSVLKRSSSHTTTTTKTMTIECIRMPNKYISVCMCWTKMLMHINPNVHLCWTTTLIEKFSFYTEFPLDVCVGMKQTCTKHWPSGNAFIHIMYFTFSSIHLYVYCAHIHTFRYRYIHTFHNGNYNNTFWWLNDNNRNTKFAFYNRCLNINIYREWIIHSFHLNRLLSKRCRSHFIFFFCSLLLISLQWNFKIHSIYQQFLAVYK